MIYPTISISLNEDRTRKLSDILRKLRELDETVSRSEALGRAIDNFHPIVCTSENTSVAEKVQVPSC